MSSVRVTTSTLEHAAAEWDLLAERLEACPFVRPDWFRIWYEAFGGAEVSVLLARSQDRLVGVLPLQTRLGVVHSPTNWHTPEFGLLAEEPHVARRLVTAAVEQARWQVQLEFLGEEDARAAQDAAASVGWSPADYVMQSSPYIDLAGTFDDYRASLSRNTRQQLGRRRRKAQARGALDFEVRSDFDDETFSAFVGLEASGWKQAQGSAIASNANELEFYREAARWAARRGWLRLEFLRLGDQRIAGDLSLVCDGAHYLLKTGYAPAYEELSPGRLLREDSTRRAFEDGLRTYELLGSDEQWKRSWSTGVRRRHRVAAFRPTWTGRALRTVHVRGRPLARDAVHRWRAWRGRR